MISVLTGIVLMVAIGTVIQRADGVSEYLEPEGPSVVLSNDVVTAQVNNLLRIDVFANDDGVEPAYRAALRVVSAPACGRVFVQQGTLQYLPDPACVGEQTIGYGIDGLDDVPAALVVAHVSGPGLGAPVRETEPVVATAVPAGGTQDEQQAASPQPASAQPEAVAAQTTTLPAQTEVVQAQEPGAAEGLATTLATTLAQGGADIANASTTAEGDLAGGFVPLARPDRLLVDATDPVLPASELPGPELSEPETVRADLAALGVPAVDDGVTGHGGSADSPVAGSQDQIEIAYLQPSPPPARLRRAQITPVIAGTEPAALGIAEPTDRLAPANPNPSDAEPSRSIDVVKASEPSLTDFLVAIFDRPEPTSTAPAELRSPDALRNQAIAPTALDPSAHARAPDALAETDNLVTAALSQTPVAPGQEAPLAIEPAPVTALAVTSDQEVRSAPDGGQQIDLGSIATPEPTAPVAPEPQADVLAALPSATAECTTPPALTLDVKRSAQTTITLEAACHAGTVAELEYSGLRFALPIDPSGVGSFAALGFEPNADAVITFVSGDVMDFDLPFRSVDRVSRVALLWDAPIRLELNALEFGADLGSSDHVRPDNPRRFEDVRRQGGGFLTQYRSKNGVGQNAQIYSHWHRRGGTTGIVKLLIDFASRHRDRAAEACGTGPFAAPQFLVLRSAKGRVDRPILRRLASESCSDVAQESADKSLIYDAVSDLVVTQR